MTDVTVVTDVTGSRGRKGLPGRREAVRLGFEHGGFKFTATIGFHPDGAPGELFLSCAKNGTAMEALSRDLAVVASLALQHGCPLATIQHALTREEGGKAAGPLGVLCDRLIAEGPYVATPVESVA